MKAALLCLIIAIVGAAALSVSSSPEARFASTDASVESRVQATVLSHQQYAALKHEEAEKAVHALHLPGDKADNLLADLNTHSEEDEAIDLAGEENEAELLSLAAETESGAEEEADSESVESLEAEIEAVEAADEEASESDLSLIESAAAEEEEAEAEEEDESEEEEEEESEEEEEEESEDESEEEEEESEEEEDASFLEVAEEDEEEEEAEEEEESEDEEADMEEDMAMIEEEGPSPYISPELREGIPSKMNDAMPDKAYDSVAEKNLFPKAAWEVGAGPKPKWMQAKKKKVTKGKAPKPASVGRTKKAARKARKQRKSKAAKKSRKQRKGSKKARKGSKKARKASKKARKASKKARKALKNDDPRKIISAPYLQDIWDARHKHFVKGTNQLLEEVDDGIIENMIYPKIADPNKKHCKKGKKAKGKKF